MRTSEPQALTAAVWSEMSPLAFQYAALVAGDAVVDPEDSEAMERAFAEGRNVWPREDDGLNAELAGIADSIWRFRIDTLHQLERYRVVPAGTTATLPLTAGRWLQLANPISNEPAATEIREKLRQSGWKLVCHVTKAEKLNDIARLGILDGGMVDHLALTGRDRRPHGNPRKQFLLSSAVFCSFWPAWWLFTDNHLASEDVVILLIDAEAVCLQPGAAFIDGAVRRRQVSPDRIRESRNTARGGITAWRSCWNGDVPIATEEQQPEIICDRIHPFQIRYALFVNEQMRDRYHPAFEEGFRKAWGDAPDARCPKPAVGAVRQERGHSLRFPLTYRQANPSV